MSKKANNSQTYCINAVPRSWVSVHPHVGMMTENEKIPSLEPKKVTNLPQNMFGELIKLNWRIFWG